MKSYGNVHLDTLREASPDDLLSATAILKLCQDHLTAEQYNALQGNLNAVRAKVKQCTAWRLDGTLREFPKFEPKNLWFRYPIHVEDTIGVLKDLQMDVDLLPYQRGAKRGGQKTKEKYKAKAADKNAELKYI